MLSRRSVRIKAMQLLFSVNRDEQLGLEEAKKRYWNFVEDTFSLYLSNLYVLVEIAKLSSEDLKKRKAKRLPTENDKVFKDKLYNNSLVKNLEQNLPLNRKLKALPIAQMDIASYCESIYQEFSKTEEYLKYIKEDSGPKEHLDILLELYRLCRQNELFNDVMEDLYGTWQDDKSVVVGAVKKSLKSLPETNDEFFMSHYPSDETVNEFGFQLLEKTIKGDETLLKYIQPTLNNWDSERLAVIDMILLKMATCELMGFPSIPTKVTINEYVDLAKHYSTAKSKEFINGVVDRIMKDFTENGLIQKEGRGLGDSSK
ncbi:MAG: N utilization substance protein B [Saprospiraceae bacterium]|jgi:N utilization substance protein B